MTTTKTTTATKASKTSTKQAKAEVATPTKHACICGCGKLVRHLFAQGHDQRVRGMLLRANGDTKLLPESVQDALAKGLIKKHGTSKPNAPVLTAKAA